MAGSLTRRMRVVLLLGSYLDARDEGRGAEASRGKPTSRSLGYGELWYDGSYDEIEDGLERMGTSGYTKIRRHVWVMYVLKRPLEARRRVADAGVDLIVKWSKGRDLWVPQEIAENEGFSTGEAKSAAKPKAEGREAA